MITVRHLVCGACFVALAALAVPEPCQAQIVGRILGGGRKSSGGGRPGVLGGLRGSGSGGPLSGGGLLGGRRAPARSDNSSSNYARSLESNRQWLSDYGKQSPQVRVSNSNPAKTAPQGKAAVRPDGVLSKSDLGIASKTAEQAQKAQQGAAQGSQAGALGKSNLAQGESPPGKPSDNFQGEGVKSAIFTGVVVAASLAQNQQLGDAYDDSWVSPGGSFVSYSEDDKGYVYHGYHDGASDDASAAPVTTGGTPGSNSTPDGAQEHSVARPPTRDSDGAVKVPAKNPLPDQVTVADRKVAKRIAREIDRLLAAEVESISQPLASYLLTDEVRVEFLKSHVTAGMDAAIVQELNNALIDLDAEAVERAAKKLNLPNDAWASLGPHARLTRALLDLKKLVKEEHSTDAVDAFSRRLDNSLADFGLNQGERDGLAASTNAVLDSLRIRLSLDDAPTKGGGELIDAPQGEVPVLYFPPLAPAGKVYLLGGSTLGVGTATPGTLVVGRSEVRELMRPVPLPIDPPAWGVCDGNHKDDHEFLPA